MVASTTNKAATKPASPEISPVPKSASKTATPERGTQRRSTKSPAAAKDDQINAIMSAFQEGVSDSAQSEFPLQRGAQETYPTSTATGLERAIIGASEQSQKDNQRWQEAKRKVADAEAIARHMSRLSAEAEKAGF